MQHTKWSWREFSKYSFASVYARISKPVSSKTYHHKKQLALEQWMHHMSKAQSG